MKNLQNKTVWITGASSGIGEALAHQFAQEGAKLVLSARRENELERVKNSLGLSEESVLVLPLDVTDSASFPKNIAQILEKFGSIDVLVLNAGVSQRTTFSEMALADAHRIMNTNFTSVLELTHAVLPQMQKQQSGALLVTSSVSGKVGTPYRTLYCASKHAVQGFFDALRGEVWRQGIQVTVICPGYIKTNISVNAIGKDGKPFGKMDVNQEKGIDVNVCAKKMVNALKAGKHEVLIAGFMETLGAFLKRFSPTLLWQFTKNYNIKAVE